ncbi:MAG TPA: MFS transporter, partial [Caldilineaceae bacterium]|nr:MFS transporter [Caldilineaceae bacterium]
MLRALPSLTRRHWSILALVASASLWGSYDLALLQLALPQIAAGLTIPATQLSNVGALIKLGSLPAFAFALAADRWGRRRLLLIAVIGFTAATGATAFAPTIATFVGLQFLARLFVTVVAIVAAVFIVEEFPAQARGWGMGALTGLSTVGGGVAALLFAAIDLMPFGWRGLYLVGLLALLLLPLWISHLPETTRFQTQQAVRTPASRFMRWQPLLQLLRTYPGRLLVISGIVLLFNLGGDAALFYDPTYLQEAHHWQPWQVSVLNLSAGFMAVVGSMVAGRMSDNV